jgi:hypothetical protein
MITYILAESLFEITNWPIVAYSGSRDKLYSLHHRGYALSYIPIAKI